MKKHSKEVEVSGHLIDSMILTKVFDKIMNRSGEFEILELKVGIKKKDSSYVKLLVTGKDAKHLQEITDDIHREGAIPVKENPIKLLKAAKNMVMPDNFYSTTNNETWVLHNKNGLK
jgi:Uncharacterized conserved protein